MKERIRGNVHVQMFHVYWNTEARTKPRDFGSITVTSVNYTREDGGEETEHVDREIRERRKIEKLFIENKKERGEEKGKERERGREKRRDRREEKKKKRRNVVGKEGRKIALKRRGKNRKKERERWKGGWSSRLPRLNARPTRKIGKEGEYIFPASRWNMKRWPDGGRIKWFPERKFAGKLYVLRDDFLINHLAILIENHFQTPYFQSMNHILISGQNDFRFFFFFFLAN